MHPNSDVSVLGYQSPRITPRLFTQLAGASADQPLFEQILALSTSLQIERDAARPEDEPSDALDPTQDRASPSTARERSTDQRPTSDAAPETAASRDDPQVSRLLSTARTQQWAVPRTNPHANSPQMIPVV